jgi:SAM-dependent methyltransferase
MLRGWDNSLKILQAEKHFEHLFNIRTSGFIYSSSASQYHYQGAPYPALMELLSRLFLLSGDIPFYDLGCGKGRALFAAEHAGFSRLTGIELNRELCEIAETNVLSYARTRNSHFGISHNDVMAIDFPHASTAYFLFNPFDGGTLGTVLDKVLKESKQKAWFLYMNPIHREEFTKRGIREKDSLFTNRYCEGIIYCH